VVEKIALRMLIKGSGDLEPLIAVTREGHGAPVVKSRNIRIIYDV
jgi:hypothetical protein